MSTAKQLGLALVAVTAMMGTTTAQAAAPSANDILAKYKGATFYAGQDFKTRMLLEIVSKDGNKRIREITQVRRTPKAGASYKTYLYFHRPDDVKKMAMIIWVDPDKADDRWVYVPAIDSIRRIAAMDEQEKFVGGDFTYEDGSGHDLSAFNSKLLRSEKVNGRDCWVVQSDPKRKSNYSKVLFWIDKKTYLALRYEYFDTKGRLWKKAISEAMQVVKAGDKLYPTHTKVKMVDVKSGGSSVMWYKDLEYDKGVNEADFTERHLRTPPRDWVK